jgi:hypothetical protein
MARIDPVDDSNENETVERVKAALRDSQRKRKAMEEERRRLRMKERQRLLYEERLERIIASGGNGGEGSSGTNSFHADVVVS